MLLLALIGCGYDRVEADYDVDVRHRTITVEDRNQNAWHSTAGDCADLSGCRAALAGVLDSQLEDLVEAGATGASARVEARGPEIDVVVRYTLGFDAPALTESDSFVRLVEVEDRRHHPRTGVAFVDLGRDSTSYTATPRGRFRSYTLAADEGGNPRMVVFDRRRGGLHVVVETQDGGGVPKHTDPWADDIPGLLASLAADPVVKP